MISLLICFTSFPCLHLPFLYPGHFKWLCQSMRGRRLWMQRFMVFYRGTWDLVSAFRSFHCWLLLRSNTSQMDLWIDINLVLLQKVFPQTQDVDYLKTFVDTILWRTTFFSMSRLNSIYILFSLTMNLDLQIFQLEMIYCIVIYTRVLEGATYMVCFSRREYGRQTQESDLCT